MHGPDHEKCEYFKQNLNELHFIYMWEYRFLLGCILPYKGRIYDYTREYGSPTTNNLAYFIKR